MSGGRLQGLQGKFCVVIVFITSVLSRGFSQADLILTVGICELIMVLSGIVCKQRPILTLVSALWHMVAGCLC